MKNTEMVSEYVAKVLENASKLLTAATFTVTGGNSMQLADAVRATEALHKYFASGEFIAGEPDDAEPESTDES